MAGGIAAGGNNYEYVSESSWLAFLCCLAASSGGALFGCVTCTHTPSGALLQLKLEMLAAVLFAIQMS